MKYMALVSIESIKVDAYRIYPEEVGSAHVNYHMTLPIKYMKYAKVNLISKTTASREGLAETEFKSAGLPYPSWCLRVATRITLLGT